MQENDNSPREQKQSARGQYFKNPWSDTTEKARNTLMMVSLIGIVMAAAGIFPKEITALGLKIQDINQRALLIIWAIVDAYFTITLISYAYSDFMRAYVDELFKLELTELPEDELLREHVLHVRKMEERLKNIHSIRLLLDISIPLLSGVIALGWLIWRSTTL